MTKNRISELIPTIPIPRMAKVRQRFDAPALEKTKLREIVFQEMERLDMGRVKPGMQVAITGGSRGISNIAPITKAIVDYVKSRGAAPFLFPSMGSHGGATEKGQLEILNSYGLTEECLGCPVRASMEVTHLGKTAEGTDVYLDRYALEADATMLCNRIKAHTDFRGDYESGLVKMAVIGMGKQKGADAAHESGFRNFPRLLPELGQFILRHSNILGGIAILENGLEETYKIYGLRQDEIMEKEPELLQEAKALMPKILLDHLDVLIVGRVGKDISGNGMDPNITGRFVIPELSREKAQRIGILELSEDTHGNFNGIGLADMITKRLFDQCDLEATYPNAVTSTVLQDVKIPFITASDKECFQLGIKTCNQIDKENPRMVYIQDTLHLENLLISEALLEEARRNPQIEVLEEPREIAFDIQGNMEKCL